MIAQWLGKPKRLWLMKHSAGNVQSMIATNFLIRPVLVVLFVPGDSF